MGAWKSIGRFISYPVLHPMRTVRGAGKTASSTVLGAGAGYVGWEKLTTDKSLTRIVGDAVIGKELTDNVDNTVNNITQLPSKAMDAIGGLAKSVDGASNQMSGIGNFVENISSGNILGGIGNFFSNIGKGKVSGMSLLGLVASAFMLFGRFGWFGKIAGALIGMMILGNNMGASRTPAEQLSQDAQHQQGNAQTNKPVQSAPQTPAIQQPTVPTLHR